MFEGMQRSQETKCWLCCRAGKNSSNRHNIIPVRALPSPSACFIAGVHPTINHQLQLQERPEDLQGAVKASSAIKYTFKTCHWWRDMERVMRHEANVKSEPINVLQPKAEARIDQLHMGQEDMTKWFEMLESQLKEEECQTPLYPPCRTRRPGGHACGSCVVRKVNSGECSKYNMPVYAVGNVQLVGEVLAHQPVQEKDMIHLVLQVEGFIGCSCVTCLLDLGLQCPQ